MVGDSKIEVIAGLPSVQGNGPQMTRNRLCVPPHLVHDDPEIAMCPRMAIVARQRAQVGIRGVIESPLFSIDVAERDPNLRIIRVEV